MRTFTENEKFERLLDLTAAGFGDTLTSAELDTTGFESVTLLAALGAVTATGTCQMKARGCATSEGVYDDIASAMLNATDTDSQKIMQIELYRPAYRYIKVTLARGTANVAVSGVFSILRDAKVVPITLSADVTHSVFLPATGEPA